MCPRSGASGDWVGGRLSILDAVFSHIWASCRYDLRTSLVCASRAHLKHSSAIARYSAAVFMELPPAKRRLCSVRIRGLNNFRNLVRTPRTFIGVLVMAGLVGKDAHEQHAAAARRTSRTHKNSRRLTGDCRHTQPNKKTNKQNMTT